MGTETSDTAERSNSNRFMFFSIMSLCSLAMGVGAVMFAGYLFYNDEPLESLSEWGLRLYLSSPILAIAGICCGLVIKSRRELRLSLLSICLFLLVFFWYFATAGRIKPLPPRLACGSCLKSLATVMFVYSIENDDQFPIAERWCDLLVERDDIGNRDFCCPVAESGPCNFALNPHGVEGTADTVLLFESKPGWNQVGGVQLLTTENHKGRGCNVAFADGRVEFVLTKDLGKLRWKAD